MTHDDLLRVLMYDPDSGKFFRRIAISQTKVGDVAGSLRKDGYVQISLKNRLYLAHRLAWLYVYGEYTDLQIDHIDRCRSNNRIVNLRKVTNKQNGENLPLLATNTSGVRNVSWDTQKQMWRVQIKHHQRNIFVGRYFDFDAAKDAAAQARDRFFTHHA